MKAHWKRWLCGNMIDKEVWPTRQQAVLSACDCAETALKFVPQDELRPRIAIETARKWAHGKTTMQEVKDAADTAYTAYTAYATDTCAPAEAAYAAYAAYAAIKLCAAHGKELHRG